MSKIKVKVLKDFSASVDGIAPCKEYKKDEILELGSPRLSLNLFEWFERNAGFGEIFTETTPQLIPTEQKIETQPEPELQPEIQKEIEPVIIEEPIKEEITQEIIEEEAEEPIIANEAPEKTDSKLTTKFNPFKKRK